MRFFGFPMPLWGYIVAGLIAIIAILVCARKEKTGEIRGRTITEVFVLALVLVCAGVTWATWKLAGETTLLEHIFSGATVLVAIIFLIIPLFPPLPPEEETGSDQQ